MKGRLSLDATHRSSPPEVFLRKGISIICCKFTREHPCRSAILIKLQSNFIEIALRHGCSPVNLLHIFRALFLKNTSGRLLLNLNDGRRRLVVSFKYWYSQLSILEHICGIAIERSFTLIYINFESEN